MCDVVMDRAKAAAGERPLSSFDITCLAKTNFRTINVHMYNPHVADIAIKAFLGRYCDVTSGAKYMKDSLGFWNGRRQFQVLLKPDKEGFDGFLHPPAVFTLGSDRGMLFYTRQPPFCKKCREYGHVTAACSVGRCRFCKSGEHEAKDCREPKECHGCGSRLHLFRDCPSRRQSYAEAAAGRKDPGPKERPEMGEQDRPSPPTRPPNTNIRKEVASGPPADGRKGPVIQQQEVEEVGGRTEELGSSLDGVEGLGAIVEMVENLPALGSRAGEEASTSIMLLPPGQDKEEMSGEGAIIELEMDPYEGKKRRVKRKNEEKSGEGSVGEGAGKRAMGKQGSGTEEPPLDLHDSSQSLEGINSSIETLSMPLGEEGLQGVSGNLEECVPNPNPMSWADDMGAGGSRESLVGGEQGAFHEEDLYSSNEGSIFASLSDEMEQGSIG